MLNRVILMGRLTQNPELKHTSTGDAVTTFSIAVNRDYTDSRGIRPTDFFDVVAWKGRAEFVTKYFSKGSMIAVEGALRVRNWEDQNQNKRRSVEIHADNISFCGGKNDSKVEEAPQQAAYGAAPNMEGYTPVEEDEELPF